MSGGTLGDTGRRRGEEGLRRGEWRGRGGGRGSGLVWGAKPARLTQKWMVVFGLTGSSESPIDDSDQPDSQRARTRASACSRGRVERYSTSSTGSLGLFFISLSYRVFFRPYKGRRRRSGSFVRFYCFYEPLLYLTLACEKAAVILRSEPNRFRECRKKAEIGLFMLLAAFLGHF